MKAIKESIIHAHHQSFSTTEYKENYFDSPWHFHEEIELTYIKSGYGTRFVGTSAELFNVGDLVLIGAKVPHYWRCNHDFYKEENSIKAHSLVIQFKKELFFNHELPEMKSIYLLLKKSASGIQFSNGKDYVNQIELLFQKRGLDRLISFYSLLESLSMDKNQKLLSTTQESQLYQAKDSETFQKILNYIFNNINHEVSIGKIAKEVHMSVPYFCRYFKKRTKKTFTQYVNNLRIVNASRLLRESDLTISQIAFDTGFNSLSYFNRQFKKIKGVNPRTYMDLYTQKEPAEIKNS
ncbi:AraC family transcriptional regulator [Aquimarina algicola]|uniref:Helix-turn-helix domain-containing protein n=1 Tax=Aquimarina algicola TaxID=2589995 RepID=A0A504J4J9_9FLAO|nr:AraC family transcriptional regulator [Aquimarina algicola]TPN82828.1 helix-turn-helix domain-containing protein [Aquimarina algicola]